VFSCDCGDEKEKDSLVLYYNFYMIYDCSAGFLLYIDVVVNDGW